MSKSSSFNILAVILIIIGSIFLLENYGILVGAYLFWPLLPLIMGIGFTLLFFKNKRKDLILLGLGTFILLNSILFFYLNFTSWVRLAALWPTFIIILGLSFLACYLLSDKNVLLYLAAILISLGVSFILIFAVSTILWPLTLIFTGMSFMIISIVERFGNNMKVFHGKKR